MALFPPQAWFWVGDLRASLAKRLGGSPEAGSKADWVEARNLFLKSRDAWTKLAPAPADLPARLADLDAKLAECEAALEKR
jgi:hypothetical protein